ncbi:Endonuclease/exonuclease/phosphatase [Beggiatoa sp. PS]|nr:Endonuclease/exonuclease/phosphatase [Beggiatoa sp. PS]
MLKIATWNVNSLRVRLPHLLDWLSNHQPDIIALQEIKVMDEQFPLAEIEAAGYHALFAGQKTYNGVALLSRKPGNDIITDFPDFNDPQRRFLGATYDKLRILNVYVPNGASVDSDKYQYKLEWLTQLQNYICDNLKQYPRLIVLGDFNIAPEDQDVYDPIAWAGKILVSPPERTALQNLLHLGLKDTFRLFEQPVASFSWWDYRRGAFLRNHGIRIDLILASTALHCTGCTIDTAPRRLERPSDHAPVVATFQ